MIGVIKKKVEDRGFGFIKVPGGADVFFHVSSVEGCDFEDLVEGQSVKFEMDHEAPKPRALSVCRA